MGRSIRWLHISDMHFCSPRMGESFTPMAKALFKEALPETQSELEGPPDFIFFTGDAAFGHIGDARGKSIVDQFKGAAEFLKQVRTAFEPAVPAENLFIVPGNHDVNRTKVTAMSTLWLDQLAEQRSGLAAVEKLIGDAGREWRLFADRLGEYKKFVNQPALSHLQTEPNNLTYAQVREVAGIRVGIAGFNSAWSCGRDKEKTRLWMAGRWQAERLKNQLDKANADLAIALIHHPANWLVGEENPSFTRFIEREFQFQLHGHEHLGWVNEGNKHVRISAAATYQGVKYENGFNAVRLDLDTGQGRVWMKRYDDDGGGWVSRPISKFAPKGVWQLEQVGWLKALSNQNTSRLRTSVARSRPSAKPRLVKAGSRSVGVAKPALLVPLATPDLSVASVPPVNGGANRPPVMCSSTTKIWDIFLPSGDVVTTEIYVDLQPIDGLPLKSLPMHSTSVSLSSAVCSATDLTNSHPLKIESKFMEKRGLTRLEYYVQFDPPLSKPIDLIVQRRYVGAILTSREAQEYAGIVYELGEESCRHNVRYPCEHFNSLLRFSTQRRELVPKQVSLRMFDKDGNPLLQDPKKAHLTYLSTELIANLRPARGPIVTGHAVFSSHNPPVGTRFDMFWKLPDQELAPDRAGLHACRQLLLLEDIATLAHTDAICHKLIRAVARKAIAVLAKNKRPGEPALFVAMHAFESDSGTLKLTKSTPNGRKLFERPLRWGKDIVGIAFQFCSPLFFVRQNFDDMVTVPVERLNPKIKVLMSYPLLWPNASGHPVGVLSLGSTHDRRGLSHAATSADLAGELAVSIQKEWEKAAKILF